MSVVIRVALSGSALGDYIFGLDPQLLVDAVITMIAMFALSAPMWIPISSGTSAT